MKKALIRSKKYHATFLYIPENQSSVKSVRMPLWGPKAMAGILIGLIVYSSFSAFALNNLKIQYDISQTNINTLTEVNNSQKLEIENLKLNALKIQEQLEENIAALEDVKAAVGLKESMPKETKDTTTPGSIYHASIENEVLSLDNKNDYDLSPALMALKTSLVSLSKETLSQRSEIEKSTVSIKNRLDYLKAIPSIVPVAAKITAGYGYRKNPFTSRGSEFHDGVDFGAAYGTKVIATGDGIVLFAGYQAGYGRMVIISHGYGFTTSYSHNSSLLVKKGDKVKRGQAISKVGSTGRSTGAHLHYEVKLNGKNVNPAKYF